MSGEDRNRDKELGPAAEIGKQLDRFYKQLPKSSGLGLAGVGAFYCLLKLVPAGIEPEIKSVLDWFFAACIMICAAVIAVGIVRGK